MDNDAMTAAVAEEIAAVMARIRAAPSPEEAIGRERERVIVDRAKWRAQLAARLRAGQAVFNALAAVDPAAAEWVRGGDLDPFHHDDRIPALLAWWRDELLDSKRHAADVPALMRETRDAMNGKE